MVQQPPRILFLWEYLFIIIFIFLNFKLLKLFLFLFLFYWFTNNMHLKCTKRVNKKGEAVLVGCDRAGSYVNPQFVHIIILLRMHYVHTYNSHKDNHQRFNTS